MIYRLRRSCALPEPLQIFQGSRGVRWLRRDVEQWILHRRSLEVQQTQPFVPISITEAPTR